MAFTPKGLLDAIVAAADDETKRQEKENTVSNTGAIPSGPRYPEVVVQLSGVDGNAFNLMGIVRRALRLHLKEEGRTPEVIKATCEAFVTEAMGGDYDNLLRVCMAWVTVE